MPCPEFKDFAIKHNIIVKKSSCCKKGNCMTFEEYMAKHFPNGINSNKGGKQHGTDAL